LFIRIKSGSNGLLQNTQKIRAISEFFFSIRSNVTAIDAIRRWIQEKVDKQSSVLAAPVKYLPDGVATLPYRNTDTSPFTTG
jgi:hypothetical protein